MGFVSEARLRREIENVSVMRAARGRDGRLRRARTRNAIPAMLAGAFAREANTVAPH